MKAETAFDLIAKLHNEHFLINTTPDGSFKNGFKDALYVAERLILEEYKKGLQKNENTSKK